MKEGDRTNFSYSRLANNSDENPTERPWSVLRIPFRNFARATVSLPLGGFVFCVIWAMYTDLDAATYTHCGVSN